MTSYLDDDLITPSNEPKKEETTPRTPETQGERPRFAPRRFGQSKFGSRDARPRTAGSTYGTRPRTPASESRGPRPQGAQPSSRPRFSRDSRGPSRGGNDFKSPQREPKKARKEIPPLAPDHFRIITLGGFEEIGKNMIAVEIGNDIIVIDAGFQFRDDETPGVDYILPNTRYLEERQDRIRGVVITHGHLDHIGGIPFIWPRIGNPKIYCRSFTALMIRKRQEEFKHLPMMEIEEVELDDTVKMGEQLVQFFGITHTIPDSMGIKIKTPYGNIINQADFKLDHVDTVVSDAEQSVYKKVASEKTLLLMCDSTNQENPGWSTPEWQVHRDLEKIIADTKGRIFLAAFASQIERLIKIVEICERYGRSVVLEGRSMRTNIEVAKAAKMLETKPNTIISAEESLTLPPHKVLILTTGAQGEEHAGLMRMATKNHKVLSFTDFDTVILSSSIIPGNENSVARLKDAIARSGAHIITYRTSELYVHGSGHGNREEVRWLHETLKPQFFVPQHGTHYMLRLHAQLAMECGMTKEQIIVPDDGSIIEIQDKGTKLVKLEATAPNEVVTVDGFSIGDVQDIVIRDRQLLSEDGIFIVILAVNPRDGRLRKSPDIISRGFVYLREEKELIQECRNIVKRLVQRYSKGPAGVDFDKLKSAISDHLRKLLLQRTAKRPLVIPVVLGI